MTIKAKIISKLNTYWFLFWVFVFSDFTEIETSLCQGLLLESFQQTTEKSFQDSYQKYL